MTRYLIVAHQTAGSDELRRAVRDILADDAQAAFTLVVPSTPVAHLGGWTHGEAHAAALEAGKRAQALFASDAVILEDVMVGDANPVYAAADCFNLGRYDHVLVSTLSSGVSRWLRMDVISRLSRELAIPVTHIAAGPAPGHAE